MAFANKVSDDHCAFALAEAFMDLKPCKLFELSVDFRIQCLSCCGHVMDRREIIFGKVFLDHHPKHGRRSTEACNLVLCKERHDILGMEAVEVIDKCCAFVQPLAVELTPHGLGPSCIGNCEVEAIHICHMPISGCMEVAQGIFVVMGCNLRVSAGSAGEEHQ